MSKHTPGDWHAEHDFSAICVGDQTLARVYWDDGRTPEENIANATLMAAAPRLLFVLEAVRENLTEAQWALREVVESAIAKATQ
jgi:hypothetical protein